MKVKWHSKILTNLSHLGRTPTTICSVRCVSNSDRSDWFDTGGMCDAGDLASEEFGCQKHTETKYSIVDTSKAWKCNQLFGNIVPASQIKLNTNVVYTSFWPVSPGIGSALIYSIHFKRRPHTDDATNLYDQLTPSLMVMATAHSHDQNEMLQLYMLGKIRKISTKSTFK